MKSSRLIKITLICLGALAIANITFGQEVDPNSYFVSIGIVIPSAKDSQFSSGFTKGRGLKMKVGYERKTLKTIRRISIGFSYAKLGKTNVSQSLLLHPEIKYEHYKRFKSSGLSLGGYVDIGSLLNFRTNNWASENQISYAIWSSLGPTLQFDRPIKFNKEQLNWHSKVSIPLISYLIRPSFTFPYTDKYLQNDAFQFDRSGLAKNIVTGGHIVTPGQFLNLQFQSGFSLKSKNRKSSYDLSYSINYIRTSESKPIDYFLHSLICAIKL